MEAIAATTPVLNTAENKAIAEQQVFYRLTALWAISEAFLGGILHAFKLPGTGLFVGGAAVICISLIAWHCPKRSAILKATILVILIKGMLSPHSPIGAYLAVFIQGGLGYLLFWSRHYFRLSCFALGIITQLQSALQRLVVLVVVFGSDVYGIANGFVNYILKKAGFGAGEYVYYIILLYLGLHLVMGIAIGWIAGKLPAILHHAKGMQLQEQPVVSEVNNRSVYIKKPKSPIRRYATFIVLSVGLILIAFSWQGNALTGKVLFIVARAFTIITIWHLLISPALLFLFNRWTATKKNRLATELNVILQLIPGIKKIISESWSNSKDSNLLKRVEILFVKMLN